MDFDDYEKLPSGHLGVHMSAGAVAGIFEHIIMYPVDAVKTRMQCLAPSPEASYTSVREGLTKMIMREGIMTPIKGVNAVILGAGPAHALYFSAYEGIKHRFGSSNSFTNDIVNAGAGCGATLVHDSIMVPADVIKQRLQMYNSPYSSCLACARHLYNTEGIRAFYRSYTTQLAMNIPHHAILIIMYEKMQKLLNPSKEYNALAHCTAGATAGAIGAAITTPLDVCKTLLNTQESSTLNQIHKARVTGIRTAFKTIYMMQGFKGFFRGMQARILYQMPSTAIAWTVYELFKHYLIKSNYACNPKEGNDLIKDGVLTQMPGQPDGGGWGGGEGVKPGPVVQEKKFGSLSSPGTVERLRELSLTASCKAAGSDDTTWFVK
uniref:Mitoferrin-1 n=1 Tax=Hirondellea gigas TaxID=1518452 RepID=A0A2P2I2F9_9CRUS